MFDIQVYLTADGDDHYSKWLASLSDRKARALVVVRIGRIVAISVSNSLISNRHIYFGKIGNKEGISNESKQA